MPRNELFFQSIVDNAPNMIFVKDAKDLSFVLFNRAGGELLGIPTDQMVGKTDYDFFPKKEADFFVAKDRETLAGKKVVDIPEESIQTRNLGVRILHTRKIPILNADGAPAYLLGISEDITERKALEEQLASYARDLASRVAERTSDLTEKVRQLEALNRAMVGREMKMVELKQEIETLKKSKDAR